MCIYIAQLQATCKNVLAVIMRLISSQIHRHTTKIFCYQNHAGTCTAFLRELQPMCYTIRPQRLIVRRLDCNDGSPLFIRANNFRATQRMCAWFKRQYLAELFRYRPICLCGIFIVIYAATYAYSPCAELKSNNHL